MPSADKVEAEVMLTNMIFSRSFLLVHVRWYIDVFRSYFSNSF